MRCAPLVWRLLSKQLSSNETIKTVDCNRYSVPDTNPLPEVFEIFNDPPLADALASRTRTASPKIELNQWLDWIDDINRIQLTQFLDAHCSPQRCAHTKIYLLLSLAAGWTYANDVCLDCNKSLLRFHLWWAMSLNLTAAVFFLRWMKIRKLRLRQFTMCRHTWMDWNDNKSSFLRNSVEHNAHIINAMCHVARPPRETAPRKLTTFRNYLFTTHACVSGNNIDWVSVCQRDGQRASFGIVHTRRQRLQRPIWIMEWMLCCFYHDLCRTTRRQIFISTCSVFTFFLDFIFIWECIRND